MSALCLRLRFRRWSLPFLCVLLASLFPLPVFAQNTSLSIPTQISSWMSFAIGLMHILTWMVFYFLNILLDPVIIFDLSEGGGLTDLLNQIWIFSRDLVNVVFAFILIGAAIYTTIRAENIITEHWKKFVAAVILVNFSWFLPRVIFDAANVTAAAIFSLPTLILPDENSCSVTSGRNIWAETDYANRCTESETRPGSWRCDCAYIADVRPFPSPQEAGQYKQPAEKSAGWRCVMGDALCYRRIPLNPNAISGRATILNGLIVNHAYLQTLADVPPPAGGGTDIRLTLMFLLRAAFILVFHALLFFPLAALAVAFFIRIPVLWLTMALMPFAVLRFVLPSGELLGDISGYMKKITDLFLKAAFLPALVAAPLALGFILVNAGAGMSSTAIDAIANVRITLFSSLNNLYQILWMLMAMGVVWLGVFGVLEKMEIMGKFSQTIKGTGESLMKLGMKLPGLVPIPGTRTTILGGLSALDPRAYQGATRIGNIQDTFRNRIGGGNAGAGAGAGAMPASLMNDEKARNLTEQMRRLTDAMKRNAGDQELQRILDDMHRSHADLGLTIQNLPQRLPQLRDAVEHGRNQQGLNTGVTNNLKDSIGDALNEAARRKPPQPPSAPASSNPPSAPSAPATPSNPPTGNGTGTS